VVAIASTSAVLDQVTYDPFGNIVTQTNATDAVRFGFAGMEYDSTTGLYYDHARYYNSVTGRFVSQDPTGFGAGDTNLYRYVANNPAGSVDTSGLAGPGRTGGVKNNPDGTPKEPGQNYEEIDGAQRMGRGRGKNPINRTKKSKQDDQIEINQQGQDALQKVGWTAIAIGVLWFIWEVPLRAIPFRNLIPA
jgi:RHS repeat-associated protein